MKINQDIEDYDIKDLNAIATGISDIQKKVSPLETMEEAMVNNITKVEQSFTSVNMARAKEIIQKYIEILSNAQTELTELTGSVEEFEEKIRRAWQDW